MIYHVKAHLKKKKAFLQQMCFIAFSRERTEFFNVFKSTRGLITKSNFYCCGHNFF